MIIETKPARRVLLSLMLILAPTGASARATFSTLHEERSRYVFVRLLVAMPGSEKPYGACAIKKVVGWRRDRQFQRYV
jgi:hypothetical protein